MELAGKAALPNTPDHAELIGRVKADASGSRAGDSPHEVDAHPALPLVWAAVITGLAFVAALTGLRQSGFLFWDAPRYANGAAMLYDWIRSGKLLHPYSFATSNYCQYPGFSIPYHPPVFPALMAGFFLLSGGVSYTVARVFMACCLAVSGWVFARLLQKLGARPTVAGISAVTLVLTPEIVRWSRDTMSEVPTLMFALAAAYFFVTWRQTERPWRCVGAFGLAEAAFLCRFPAAGLMPAWVLFLLFTKDFKAFRAWYLYVLGALYLLVSGLWVLKLAIPFAKYETVAMDPSFYVPRLSWANIAYYPENLPALAGWSAVVMALGGLVYMLAFARSRIGKPMLTFWLAWLISYYGFQLFLAKNEARYFTLALPGLVGLIAVLLDRDLGVRTTRVAFAALCVVLVEDVLHIAQLPRGTTAYEQLAARLATQTDSGDVLVAAPQSSDFIFRYRARKPAVQRRVLRGDRSLTIDAAEYAGVPGVVVANSPDGVIRLLRESGVRYVVTFAPTRGKSQYLNEQLAYGAVKADSGLFEPVASAPFSVDPGGVVSLWRYVGPFARTSAPSTAVIPTAGLELSCRS
jgi:4-amino-4-deoxy-L-arabinose transferase-like glycosyltransferase